MCHLSLKHTNAYLLSKNHVLDAIKMEDDFSNNEIKYIQITTNLFSGEKTLKVESTLQCVFLVVTISICLG
jgi:hypothetical protein